MYEQTFDINSIFLTIIVRVPFYISFRVLSGDTTSLINKRLSQTYSALVYEVITEVNSEKEVTLTPLRCL